MTTNDKPGFEERAQDGGGHEPDPKVPRSEDLGLRRADDADHDPTDPKAGRAEKLSDSESEASGE